MGKGFCALFKKDCRMLASGKFFLMAIGFLALYTAYVNLGYIRFMQMEPYNVYLYDPAETQASKSSLVQTVPSMEAMDAALSSDANGVGLDASAGDVRVVLYRGAEHIDRHRADYALSLLEPLTIHTPEVLGTNTPEQKARKEITCELLFFELAAVGFLGIAAVLFKEKGMGVIRVHAILPLQKDLFLLSKLAVFLLSDLVFAVLLTLLNTGLADGTAVLPAVLLQTTILSLMMALVGLLCALLLKDFRQFTLAYLVIAMKSVLRDKFCLMTFLLPILAAVALNFMGSIDMSSLGELHFGVLENDLSPQTITWLKRYGPVTAYGTQEELTDAINEPSTNVIGVRADGDSLKTAVSGDELDIFRQAAATLPTLYEQRAAAGQAEILTLERPDIMESLQGIFIPAVLIVAMFMGCTFNTMNIISEKEDGVAFVNEILPMTPSQYILQKVVVGFLFGSLSSVVTACICFRLSLRNFGLMLALIVLSSFVAALIGLFIGKFSEGLMIGVVYIKIVMLLFLAVPLVCALTGVSGPLVVICNIVPSQPAFEGIMALSAGSSGTAMKDTGILAIHCIVWFALYILISARRKKPAV